MEDRIKFLGKAELFKIPVFGYILKKLGGYPVLRNKQNNSVDSVVNIFKQNNKFFHRNLHCLYIIAKSVCMSSVT